MPRNASTTSDRQARFLREFIRHRGNPPPTAWPPPLLLRRWLRRPRFAAFDSLVTTYRYQSDIHLTCASLTAAQSLAPASAASEKPLKAHLDTLRLSHTRQRFAPPPPPPEEKPPGPPPEVDIVLAFLRGLHPRLPVADALEYFHSRTDYPLPPPAPLPYFRETYERSVQ